MIDRCDSSGSAEGTVSTRGVLPISTHSALDLVTPTSRCRVTGVSDQPKRGLYEALITDALHVQLAEATSAYHVERVELDSAEAPDRYALHLARVIERALRGLHEKSRVQAGAAILRGLIGQIATQTGDATHLGHAPIESGELLRAITGRLPDGSPASLDVPLTSLLDTTLLTNAPGEPRIGSQVLAEIPSADRIDLVMAFIRISGIAPLLDALQQHRLAGRSLRILTTTYTGSTQVEALDALHAIGADIRVSYDETSTRLHAKAWLFQRDSGYSTAYIRPLAKLRCVDN